MTEHAPDWSAQVRQIYENETSAGYKDIAYHYLVDPDGVIYEGRWARGFPGFVRPDGRDGFGRLVRGGHARGHNTRSLGVALLGDYTQTAPSAAAVDALVALLVWQSQLWRIDATGSSWYRRTDGTIAKLPNVLGHGDVRVTECPGARITRLIPDIRERVAREVSAPPAARGGYWIVARDGRAAPFGTAARTHSVDAVTAIAGVAASNDGLGYWTFGSDGGVFTHGAARFHGSLADRRTNAPIVGLAPTAADDGYWLVASDGGVFAFGGATFHGSLADTSLNVPIAGMCATANGSGYFLFAADGGVFAFGDAQYRGSLAATSLNAPITAMAASPDGYWLAGSDGGVFAFGDARYAGGGGADTPVVAIRPTTTNRGYVLLTAAGQVLPFGDAPYYGSATGDIADAVGIAGRIVPDPE